MGKLPLNVQVHNIGKVAATITAISTSETWLVTSFYGSVKLSAGKAVDLPIEIDCSAIPSTSTLSSSILVSYDGEVARVNVSIYAA